MNPNPATLVDRLFILCRNIVRKIWTHDDPQMSNNGSSHLNPMSHLDFQKALDEAQGPQKPIQWEGQHAEVVRHLHWTHGGKWMGR